MYIAQKQQPNNLSYMISCLAAVFKDSIERSHKLYFANSFIYETIRILGSRYLCRSLLKKRKEASETNKVEEAVAVLNHRTELFGHK